MYRIIVVGCGAMSGKWIEIASKRHDCKIVALVDSDIAKAKKNKERYLLDSNIYSDLVSALLNEDVNLVFDITSPQNHFSTVITALKAGCHVFGEKPMSDSLENAYKMVECSNQTGNEYFIMQNRRYMAQLDTMKSFLQKKELGNIGQLSANFHINPNFGGFRQKMGSPLLADMAIHTFDTARFILEKNPTSIYCHEFNPSWSWSKGDSSAICIFEMEDGSVFDYRGSWCSNGLNTSWESEWRASCAEGSLYWDGAENLIFDRGNTTETGIHTDDDKVSSICRIEYSPTETSGHTACMNEMFIAIKHGTRPQTDCRDNIKSLEMVHRAIESAISKRRIVF